jgi:hypothetical protein
MEYYFDTSSLVALARYYHPFDKNGRLFDFVRSKFQNKEIIVLDAILNEAKFTSKGIVLQEYPFIEEQKDLIIDTKELMPYSTKKFGNMVDKNFAVAALLNNGKVNYSIMKQGFLNSGDGKLILTMYNRLHDDKEAEICIVTEESKTGNDGKIFKKIPVLCDFIGVRCITLVEFLADTPFYVDM